ncbi:substrate-binding domain-containing protein [Riemerella columbina]|nr:substrate-binding domain-containing protein [Riemerella columbina]WKS95393.1 substrate-binding domain-containing protein [Riemerella columbina]
MMTNFIQDLGIIDEATVYPLYLRELGLIVRKGNPKNIRNFEDLLQPNTKIMVVNGAGLTGTWEDLVMRYSVDIKKLRLFRKNIVMFAINSGAAAQTWKNSPEIEVWLSWNIWQKQNETTADFV